MPNNNNSNKTDSEEKPSPNQKPEMPEAPANVILREGDEGTTKKGKLIQE